MTRHFIRSHYCRKLYQCLQNLTQSAKSVENYHKEIEMAMIKANIEEDKETTVARFLPRLKGDIQDIMRLQYYMELEDLIHLAMKVEK